MKIEKKSTIELNTDLQKGNAKPMRKDRVYKTKPKEAVNAGRRVRVDSRTVIYVKDGVTDEEARIRYLSRLKDRD